MFKGLEKIVTKLRKSNITEERNYAEVCHSISEAAYKNDVVWNSLKEDIDIAAKNGKFKYVIEDIESSREADKTVEMLNFKGFKTNVRKFVPDDDELYHITVSW